MSLGANHGTLFTVLGEASVSGRGEFSCLSDEVTSSEFERAAERSK